MESGLFHGVNIAMAILMGAALSHQLKDLSKKGCKIAEKEGGALSRQCSVILPPGEKGLEEHLVFGGALSVAGLKVIAY